jgi:hypothetical protein
MLRDQKTGWQPIYYGTPFSAGTLFSARHSGRHVPSILLSRTFRLFGVLLIAAVVVGFSLTWLQMPPDGELTVKTTPSGAMIIVDGLPRGSSPLRLSGLRPGTHQFQALMPGYKGAVLQVEVFPSKNESLDWMLEPTHSEGRFRQLAALFLKHASELI